MINDAINTIIFFINNKNFDNEIYNLLTANYTVRQILKMIKSVNSCLNCENLVESLKCAKHDVDVEIDNVCNDHSIKKAFSKLSTRPCNVSTTNSGSFFSQNDVKPTKSHIKIATSSYLLDLTFPDD